ncbi:MAG: cupin domain-containing protein [Candidatus Staskawiczbacteria bacterium]|nr:cupin domain-containing protein [Candidatus Staskawiczbacteria bacterium]
MKKVIVKKIKPAFEDKRGSISDLLNEKINHVGLIVTKKGCVRANHYHKLSTQYNYVLSGKFEVFFAKASNPSNVKKIILRPGELIIIPPMTIHRFKAIEKTILLDLISESRAGRKYESDTVRVPIIN